MSKGSGRRPQVITQGQFDDSWERIFGRRDNKADSCESAQHQDQSSGGDTSAGAVSKDKQGDTQGE